LSKACIGVVQALKKKKKNIFLIAPWDFTGRIYFAFAIVVGKNASQ
jgi:hypothetical protein